MKLHVHFSTLFLAAISLVLSFHAQAEDESSISDLHTYQLLTRKGQVYLAAPEIHITFTLARAADDVTVEVGRHHADGTSWPCGMWPAIYLANPFHVQTLRLGHLEAGPHEAIWNGLDEKGNPVVEASLMPRDALIDLVVNKKVEHPTAEQMTLQAPVDLFRVTVKAAASEASLNFRRVSETVGAYREATVGFIDSLVEDGKGGFVAANLASMQSARLSPSFQPIEYYPSLVENNNQNDCLEVRNALNDGQGHALFGNGHSLFRYDLNDGENADWTEEPYTHRMYLGQAIDMSKASEDTVKKTPGMGNEFRGWGTDAEGNIYTMRQIFSLGKHPSFDKEGIHAVDVQIFDNNGVFKRTLPLPIEAALGKPGQAGMPCQFAVAKNGDFWAGSLIAYLIDGKTGAIKGQFKKQTGKVVTGQDGSVFAWPTDNGLATAGDIYRLHADGTPYPFGTNAPGRKDNGESMSLGGDDSPLPPAIRKAVPVAICSTEKGDFYVVIPPGQTGQPILHFSADGSFLPEDLPRIDLMPSRDGNVFVGDQPAIFDFIANNLGNKDRTVTVDWTLTDFFGQKTSGKRAITFKNLSRDSSSITVPADEFGFYTLEASIEGEGVSWKTSLVRVRPHDPKFQPDSPFAMVWDNDFALGALAGVKKERIGSDMWQWREPVQGLVVPDVPDSLQSGFSARRNFASQNGILEAEMSNYGEPWTEGFYVNQIHNLSLYLKDWMGVVDKVQGHHVAHYQFWNEPSDFWNAQKGPNIWDLYDIVNGDYWDINKARDKETSSIADEGFDDFRLMAQMGSDGTAIYNDAIECHYPTERPDHHFGADLGVSEMGSQGFPEDGADDLQKLVAIRDQAFPGKPILDTEDSWYGDHTISMKAGADAVPRLFIPKLAVGADEIYWFSMQDTPDEPTTTGLLSSVHYPDLTPQAAFCSYATMTQLLQGAEFVGPVDLKAEAKTTKPSFAYLFRKGDQAILVAWTMLGHDDISLPLGVDQVTIYDIMSRQSNVSASGGGIPLHLGDSAQYVTFPFNDWAKSIAKNEMTRQLTALQVGAVFSLPREMKTAAQTALTSLPAMNRFYHLVKAARQAAFAGVWFKHADNDDPAKQLRATIVGKEGDDGYLRQSRLPLNWIEQIDRVAQAHGGDLESALLSVSADAAEAAQPMVSAEPVLYPGVAVNAYIGDPGEIEKVRAVPSLGPNYPFYESNFRTQIPKKAGENFEMELTAWNFYRHPVQGKLAPKLPDGWTAVASSPQQDDFSLEPEKFLRILYTVTIPAGAKPGIYPVDGEVTYRGAARPGVMAQRIQVQ